MYKYGLLLCALLLLTSCATNSGYRYAQRQDGLPDRTVDVNKIPNAVPKVEPLSKYGNPPSYVALGKRYYVLKTARGYSKRGIASWYGTKFQNYLTSSGEPYDMFKMTAASKTLPLPTFVKVTNLENHRQIIVKVNDRGPFHPNRIIDLSYVAAKKLGMIPKGTALVQVTAIDPRASTTNLPLLDDHLHTRPHLYLQTGAFRVHSNAIRMRHKLKDITTYPVFIHRQRDLYEVRIGPLPSVNVSDNLTAELKGHGIDDSIYVR